MLTETAQTLKAIRYEKASLEILNQLVLPFESVYENVDGVDDGHKVIKTMKVRGAPAIAIVAALSLAVELCSILSQSHNNLATPSAVQQFVHQKLEYLKTSRPTAVNLFEAAARLDSIVSTAAAQPNATPQSVANAYITAAEAMLEQDIKDNKNIGHYGAQFVLQNKPQKHENVQVLTHCNTGSLATAGWGTALGIIRDLHATGSLAHAYCTETRPYNQGSRLTAYELVYEQIPATLVCDDMASALLARKPITAIIVGADRVAANGDTANKIGTYQLAITAKYHNVLFIVAAPSTSIDLNTATGKDIPIEERAAIEVVQIRGKTVDDEAGVKESDSPSIVQTETVHVAAPGIGVWNPAFDVTPASLISAIVTEKGVCVKKPGNDTFDLASFLSQ